MSEVQLNLDSSVKQQFISTFKTYVHNSSHLVNSCQQQDVVKPDGAIGKACRKLETKTPFPVADSSIHVWCICFWCNWCKWYPLCTGVYVLGYPLLVNMHLVHSAPVYTDKMFWSIRSWCKCYWYLCIPILHPDRCADVKGWTKHECRGISLNSNGRPVLAQCKDWCICSCSWCIFIQPWCIYVYGHGASIQVCAE